MSTLLLVGYLFHASSAEDDTCTELGFTGLQLCSDCDRMAEYIKDEELVADCRKCCAKESKLAASEGVKFDSAVLEICS